MSDSNKHTPPPWYASNEGGEWRVMTVDENGGYTLADMCCSDQEANACRIVACVNALEGLNDYALSGGWSFRGIEAYAKGLEKQRDELLVALVEARIAMRAFADPDGNMPEKTGEFADLKLALTNAEKAIAGIKGPWCCEKGQSQGKQVCDECAEINDGYQSCLGVSVTSIPAIVFYPAGSLGEEVQP